ncbi:MAG TPA: succinylglutamate desuccinylase [Verrucomicrobiales bacterium]|nr:succinylglutamate desuccinylase [Verrucomicrobiales bacterium]
MAMERRDSGPHLRVGRNAGGYGGERLDPDALIARLSPLAASRGWIPDPIVVEGQGPVPAWVRTSPAARWNLYLSSGIHGDEPAGPLAVERLLAEERWPVGFNLWVVPCLNPEGFRRNTREDGSGIDLNRDYRNPRTATVRGHLEWFSRQPAFDLTLVLHEDWESNGFYVYELNPDGRPSLAPAMVEAVARVCPVDHGETIDGRAASGGMIRFVGGGIPDRIDWPESLYLVHHKTRLSYTMEAPSDFVMEARIQALVAAVRTAMERYAE